MARIELAYQAVQLHGSLEDVHEQIAARAISAYASPSVYGWVVTFMPGATA